MEAPVCLIENRRNRLHAAPGALRLLSEIRKPVVVVVSVVGLYLTGKSYLMNKLAGKNSGFSLGSTVQAKTKGIWMWCVPYPDRPNHTLVLLDTEGLGDIEKGSSQNDTWIFALAVLLSSTLVYNSMGTIDQTALDKLHFVTELSEYIKAKAPSDPEDPDDSSDFVGFFPTFVWSVRDFALHLERDGQPITEDEYLETALELQKVLAKLVETYVDTISSGKVPCLENTVLALAEIENTAAVQEAVARYEKLMERSLKLPTNSLQELLDIHKTCEKEALQMFMARAFKDDKRHFQLEFMKSVESKKEEYCRKNKDISSDICFTLLSELSESLEKNIKKGSYSRVGGHQEFLNDLQKVEKQFFDTPKKGIMAWRTLKSFLRDKEGISKTILQHDLTLQRKEKEIEDEKMKAKATELEKEVQKREKEMLKQKLEDHRESQAMNLQKLKEKMVEEKRQMLGEYDMMMKSKLREQNSLLQEGFEKEASQLNEKMEELRKKKEEVEKPSWLSSALENLRTAIHEKISIIHDEVVEPVVDRFKNLIQKITSKA